MYILSVFTLAYIQLAQLTAADWAGWLALVGILAKIVTDQLNRIQDRLDAESKAKLILDTLEAQEKSIKAAASEREERIVAKIEENTEISVKAFDAANGHNEKIKSAVESVAEVVKVIADTTPKEVHVTVEAQK